MMFQALLVSKDEEATSVLNPVLDGFGVTVENCGYPDALGRLTEQKFDAVLVDFDDPHSAALVLQAAHQASPGNQSVTVALLNDATKVRNAFGAGANFVLYKPISAQKAQTSLKAATALIRRERRRSFRVPVQVPVQLSVQNGPSLEGILLDLSEDGMDILASQALCPSATVAFRFTLPHQTSEVDARGEVAWANPNGQSGMRFVDISEKLRSQLRSWVAANAPYLPPEDIEPFLHCKLSDLSLGGCYVETESPFPENARLVLTLAADGLEVRVETLVRVMHPGFGMGMEFPSRTQEQREQVCNFIDFLAGRPGIAPQLSITPSALSAHELVESTSGDELNDPLLELLRRHANLTQEEFLQQLRQQRHGEAVSSR